LGPPAPSPPPAVVVEIAESIEAALQVFRSAALCLCNALPWHIPAPLEMPSRIVVPGWPLQAATEALVGVRLDDCDARINLACCALALDIAAAVVPAKAK
jgi:hypothetical protein